ncbi:hypothetical protein D3C84_404890 [compost metagenome]
MKKEFVVLQALAQVYFQSGACRGNRLHFRIEEAHGIAARRLGAIHRQVSALQNIVRCAQLPLEQRNAEAGGAVVLISIQLVGNVQRVENLFANSLGLDSCFWRILIKAIQQDNEFVSAQASHGVALAYAAAKAQSNLLQQHVASVMPQRVVQCLEVIQVNENYPARMQATGAARQQML